MLSIVFDVPRFQGEDSFRIEIQRFVAWVKSSAKATPNGEILMPGEIEERTKAQRLRDGIDIDATTWSQVVDTARSLGLGEDHWVAV
jgi:hydroxycarboxylate dehydrogenase B